MGNFVWLDGLLLETGALTSFQVADNKEGEKKTVGGDEDVSRSCLKLNCDF